MRAARMVHIAEKGVIFYREEDADLVEFFGPQNTFVVCCTHILVQLEGKGLEVVVDTKENPSKAVRFTHIGGPITVVWAD